MTKRFRKGLVVGKFSPLTLGHEGLLEFASQQSDQLLILSYSSPEFPKCERAQRERWLKQRFPQAQVVVIDHNWLEENKVNMAMPHNDEPDDVHREFCANVMVYVIGTTCDAVFSSEDYGDGFAAYLSAYFKAELSIDLNVTHVMYDKDRSVVPISATRVRADLTGMKSFVSSNVYASLMPRLVVLGGESSGKTALAKALAQELNTAWVSEYGRDFWEKHNGDLRYEDMAHIAQTQIKSELILARRFGNKVLVCDTSPLTTLFYCKTMFGNNFPPSLLEASWRKYDYTILCAPTIPFDQDGTRRDEEFRQTMHEWYVRELEWRRIPYKLVEGSVEERVAQVREYISM